MSDEKEWLEVDGLGGFAMGTANLIPTRRYHALLMSAVHPPTSRMTLVNGVEVFASVKGQDYSLSALSHGQGIFHPTGHERIAGLSNKPWPKWSFVLREIGVEIVFELFMVKELSQIVLSWKQLSGDTSVILNVRPLITVRDYHALHYENDVFCFDSGMSHGQVEWVPYPNCPIIRSFHNGKFSQKPLWIKSCYYKEEEARGYDAWEDLASPGIFTFDLAHQEAYLIFSASDDQRMSRLEREGIQQSVADFRREEASRRSQFPSPLHEAADSYVVTRGDGKSIVAGYPWFTDWGRDTFIAFRGACLTTRRFDCGAAILSTWLGTLSEGMIPNRFPDIGLGAEYNSVDASLWFVIAAGEFIAATPRKYKDLHARLKEAIIQIISFYHSGTRYHIHADKLGLLHAGVTGTQLTWMDARCDNVTFTPRVGKPVEVQALWYNALIFAAKIQKKWGTLAKSMAAAFEERFWNPERGILYDVIDVDHQEGVNDDSFRPNQLFAIGGLPHQLLDGEKAQLVVEACQRELLTPFGMRTLNPDDSRFAPKYAGNNFQRDSCYHQGTVWPWLIGPFVEAWLRVNGDTPENRKSARELFLGDLIASVYERDGVGHIGEIHDGTMPFKGRGCPFQAWSVTEVLRLVYDVLAP